MSDYFSLKSAIFEEAKNLETALPIRNEACRPKFFLHSHPTSKVCLFFHGFTAGPYQFEPIGKVLFEAGYNVLIPLQPGHGIAGDWNRDNPPPLPTEAEVYQQFALSWLKVALSLGEQVVIGGLSSGGTLAAWLGLERPQQIQKAILFAPYLSQSSIVDLLVEVLSIYYEWPNKDNPGNFGYSGFRMPALRLFLNMGKELLEKVENHPAVPMFVISSDSDRTIDKKELQALFASLLKQQSKSWYHRFDQIFEIPHTMMTKAEGNQYTDLLIAVAKSYLESDLTWDELLEIGHQILNGKNLATVIQELNLTSKVAPDISILLTVMDKKTIIDAYYWTLEKKKLVRE